MPKHFITVDGKKFYCTKAGELFIKDGEPQEVTAEDTTAEEVDVEAETVAEVKSIIAEAVAASKGDVAKAAKEAKDAVADLFNKFTEGARGAALKIGDLSNAKAVTVDTDKITKGLAALAAGETKGFVFELHTKADLDVLAKATGTGDFTGDVVVPDRDPELTRNPVRQPFIEQIANVVPVESNGLSYVEVVTENGAPATTAELAAIPEKDLEYEEFRAPLKKVAVVNKHSVELLQDAPQLAAEIQGMLAEDINIVVDTQLLTGDGTGTNLLGVMARATELDAAAIGAQRIANPNLFDVARIAMTKISVAGKGKFIPTHVALNPADAEELDLTKASDGHYVMPAFVTADGLTIKGARVIENTGIPAGEFLVGDFRKLKVGRKGGVEVEFSTSDGTDFAKDIMAIKLRRRVASYVRTNHSGAFMTGDIAAVKAALVAA